jgi:hypothetical protein
MRSSLFAGRRLRASYRNVPMDDIVALIERADEQDETFFDSGCLHRSRRLRSGMKEENQR